MLCLHIYFKSLSSAERWVGLSIRGCVALFILCTCVIPLGLGCCVGFFLLLLLVLFEKNWRELNSVLFEIVLTEIKT